MEYLKIDGEFPRLSGSAVTLGKFDGIHRGHRKLVERILEQKEKGLQTVLFSLGIGSQMIFTKEERCRILEDAGVDVLIECPLDARIRHMKADTFIKSGTSPGDGKEAWLFGGCDSKRNGRKTKDQQYLYP